MARETSAGLKILWIWTIGTAAIMVTNVVRTRLRDMDQVMNNEQHQQQSTVNNSILVDTSPETVEGVIEEVKT